MPQGLKNDQNVNQTSRAQWGFFFNPSSKLPMGIEFKGRYNLVVVCKDFKTGACQTIACPLQFPQNLTFQLEHEHLYTVQIEELRYASDSLFEPVRCLLILESKRFIFFFQSSPLPLFFFQVIV